MTYQEKLIWLRKIFSNDPQVRTEAMSAEIPQPLFESQEDFAKALEELSLPEMQCVNCWHRWKPEQPFRDTPRCPECGSTLNPIFNASTVISQVEHEHKLPW